MPQNLTKDVVARLNAAWLRRKVLLPFLLACISSFAKKTTRAFSRNQGRNEEDELFVFHEDKPLAGGSFLYSG